MKLLLIGSGSREHALLWKLKQNPRITECYVAPGNAGTGTMAVNVPIEATNIAGLLQFAEEKKIDLTIVGPDDPLAAGIVDQFQQAGLRIFGPTAAAARFESSKSFAKDFMKRHGIPTAASETFTSSEKASAYVRQAKYPLVVKADGLGGSVGLGCCAACRCIGAIKKLGRPLQKINEVSCRTRHRVHFSVVPSHWNCLATKRIAY